MTLTCFTCYVDISQSLSSQSCPSNLFARGSSLKQLIPINPRLKIVHGYPHCSLSAKLPNSFLLSSTWIFPSSLCGLQPSRWAFAPAAPTARNDFLIPEVILPPPPGRRPPHLCCSPTPRVLDDLRFSMLVCLSTSHPQLAQEPLQGKTGSWDQGKVSV